MQNATSNRVKLSDIIHNAQMENTHKKSFKFIEFLLGENRSIIQSFTFIESDEIETEIKHLDPHRNYIVCMGECCEYCRANALDAKQYKISTRYHFPVEFDGDEYKWEMDSKMFAKMMPDIKFGELQTWSITRNYTAQNKPTYKINLAVANDKIIELPTAPTAPAATNSMTELAKKEMEKMHAVANASVKCSNDRTVTPETRQESTQSAQPTTTVAAPEIIPERVEMPQSPADRDALITNAINRFMGSGMLTVPLTMHSYFVSVMRHLAYNSPDIYTSIMAGVDDEYGKKFIAVLKNHLSNPAIQEFNDTQKWNFLTVDINALLAKIAA